MQEQLILIYEEKDLEKLDEKSLEAIENYIYKKISYEENILETIKENSNVVFYLDDEKLHELILKAKEKKINIGFLPHPLSNQITEGFSVNNNFVAALEEIKQADKIVDSDVLFCNNSPVFNYVVIGDIITILTRKNKFEKIKDWIKKLIIFLKLLGRISPKLFYIKADDKNELETAASGLLIVQHGKNSVISRLILEDSYLNDGMFHTLIYAPRSITQLLKSYIKMLIRIDWYKDSKYDFIGHIKTNNISIKTNQEISYTVDGKLKKANEFEFKIEEGLKILPSKTLSFYKEEKKPNKIYKVEKLPRGEAKQEMLSKHLPFIDHASTDEYKELFTTLRENGKPKSTYLVLMVLSTILATFGLFSNSSPVIIGAMILAPLMAPIISLSMGVLRQENSLIKNSLITIGLGLLLSYIFAIIITLITPLHSINAEISARIKPNILDLGIAIVSGAAGAYAHAKEEIAKTLAGVAIAVALVPPLAVSGIGIGWGSWEVFFGAFLLLLTNLTGMVLSGSLTFLLFGFSPFKLAKRGLLISSFVVFAISFPLAYGFIQVVKENRIIESVNDIVYQDINIKDAAVIQSKPLILSIKIISDHNPSDEELEAVKQEIEEKLGKKVELEISISLKRK